MNQEAVQTPDARKRRRTILSGGRRNERVDRSGAEAPGSEAFALHALARELAGPANRLGLLAGAALRGLLVAPAQLHLAEYALALHLLLQRFQGLIDIIVANDYLDDGTPPSTRCTTVQA